MRGAVGPGGGPQALSIWRRSAAASSRRRRESAAALADAAVLDDAAAGAWYVGCCEGNACQLQLPSDRRNITATADLLGKEAREQLAHRVDLLAGRALPAARARRRGRRRRAPITRSHAGGVGDLGGAGIGEHVEACAARNLGAADALW